MFWGVFLTSVQNISLTEWLNKRDLEMQWRRTLKRSSLWAKEFNSVCVTRFADTAGRRSSERSWESALSPSGYLHWRKAAFSGTLSSDQHISVSRYSHWWRYRQRCLTSEQYISCKYHFKMKTSQVLPSLGITLTCNVYSNIQGHTSWPS